jgi:Ferritin-like
MLRVQPGSIDTLDDLRSALQSAIQLEHATLPPYLTAFFTISGTGPGPTFAAQTLHDIFMEEMLHMHLACNILNAIGGHPLINSPDFIPSYPGPLPMGIGSGEPGGLSVGIKRYSRATVHDTFMEIEEPENVIDIPVQEGMLAAQLVAAAPTTYETIGEFYLAIRTAIETLGENIFTGIAGLQVPGPPGYETVHDVASATAAINLIITQGEGTPTLPTAPATGEIAHYYRFEQLYRGMEIVPNPTEPDKYAFDPARPIVIDDAADVVQMVDNPMLVPLDPQSDWRAIQLSDEFDLTYTRLLNRLHIAFNGQPDAIDGAIALMYELKNGAEELLQQRLTTGPFAGQFAGPRFRYVGP